MLHAVKFLHEGHLPGDDDDEFLTGGVPFQ